MLVAGPLQGCSTHAKRLIEPRTLYFEGQLEPARERLEKLAQSRRHDREVALLDLAIVDLVGGRPVEARRRLQEVSQHFVELEEASLAENTVSMWTDDQVRAYGGEDYERILVYAFLALADLMDGGSDAEAFTLQLDDEQQRLAQKTAERLGDEAAASFPPVPFGPYLRGVLREATLRDYDDAAESYRQVCAAWPDSQAFQWDWHRAQHSVHSSPGCGVIYVVGLVGRGPIKVEVAEQPTSDALLIADRIVSAAGPYSVPPTLAAIKVPQVQVPPSDIDGLYVGIDRSPVGPTTPVTSIEHLALQTQAAQRSSILARAVARRVIKKASVAAAKKSMGTEGLTSLAMDAAGVAWEATESADTRCWGLLPREIQVLRVEVPSGRHRLDLQPFLHQRAMGRSLTVDVDVSDGRNSYVLACFPDQHAIGHTVRSP